MKLIYSAVVTLLVFLCSDSFAQQKSDSNITGHVVDKTTGQHIPFATIASIKNIGVISDETGHYMINNIPVGTIEFEASCMGYKPETQSITIEKGKTYVLHFELEPSAIELDEVVVTGNRYATNKRETNSVVNVINPKQFEKTSAVNPAGVLDFQPGARVEYNCGNCGVPQLRINGLSGQYSQVLLDSRPIFSSLGMVYGLEQFPSSMIERIELVRGGGSALFGANAIGGTVNIITKEPTSSQFQLSNQTGLIGGKSLDANTSLNGSIISSDYKSGVYLFSMIRDRDKYDHNGDGFSDMSKIKSQTVGVRAFQKIGERSKITAEYHHIHEFRRGGDMFDAPPHEANIAEQLNHNIDGGGLNYDFVSKDGSDRFNVYMSGQNIDRDSYFGTQQNPNAYGKTTDVTLNSGLQWTHNFKKLFFMPSVLTLGSDYTYNNLEDKMIGYDREIKQKVNLIGVYAQNEWNTKNLGLLIGGRIDKHTMVDKPIVSPRVSVRYAPSSQITLRTSYARGYRAPQTYDEDLHVGAVGGDVALIEISPNLKPEYSNTANISFDYWETVGQWKINILTEGFFTNLKNVFALEEKGSDSQGNLLLERVNASGAMVAGVNAELRSVYADKVDIQLGYTWQKSRYKEPFKWSENENIKPQKTMFRSPDSYGYMMVDYKPVKPLTLSFNGTYTGKMLMQHYKGTVPADMENITQRFVDMSLRAAYDFNVSPSIKMQVSLSVKNLLNSYQDDLDFGMYKDSKYIYGPALPRSYFVGLKFFY